MRTLAGLFVALLWLGACAPQQTNCDVTVTRHVNFSSAEAQDTIAAHSLGASCAEAVGVITVTSASGEALWAWAIPLARAFGDEFVEPDAEAMRAFLERWSLVEITTTGQAPEWPLLAPGQTTLDRLTYDDIRARNLPMLCHFIGTARQSCVFFEPAAHGAGLLLERPFAVTEEAPA